MNVAEVAAATSRLFDAAALPHAFGGALALNFYADPRATLDVDVNVFVPWESLSTVIAVLEPIGYLPERSDHAATPIAGVRLTKPGTLVRLDLFLSTHDRYRTIQDRVNWFPFGPEGEHLPFLSAEDIALFKVSFNRDKDWVDLRRMIQGGPPFDLDYLERTLVEIRGPSMYPRVARLRAMSEAGGELR